jgi:hypothetical protein
MQAKTLLILEEAGAEEVCTLLNTLLSDFTQKTPDAFLELAAASMKSLWSAGYIYMTRDLEKPGLRYVSLSAEETLAEFNFKDRVVWDRDRKFFSTREDQRRFGRVSIALKE